MRTPHSRRSPQKRRFTRLLGGAVLTAVGLKLLVWTPRLSSSDVLVRWAPRALISCLVQRFIVPDLRVALQGVLGEAGGHIAVSVLDCWDERWASVWAGLGGGAAAGSPKVVVDDVVCIDFSGAPDAGDGAAGGEPLAPAPSVPWLQHRKSLVHINHAPRGGASTPSAKLAESITTGRKSGGHSSSSPSSRSPPRTILALASPDGQSMPVRYVTLMTSLASAGSPPPRLVLVDTGNTFGADGAPTASKKPRAPGFQVINASPARHAFYALSVNTVQGTFSKVYGTGPNYGAATAVGPARAPPWPPPPVFAHLSPTSSPSTASNLFWIRRAAACTGCRWSRKQRMKRILLSGLRGLTPFVHSSRDTKPRSPPTAPG